MGRAGEDAGPAVGSLTEMTDNVDVAALARWIREFARLVAANKDLLTTLDSAIGDADHGATMDAAVHVDQCEV